MVIQSKRVVSNKVPPPHNEIMDGFLLDEYIELYNLPPYYYNPMREIDVKNRQGYAAPRLPINEPVHNYN